MEYKELARFSEEDGTLLFEDVTIDGKLEWLKITRRAGSFATFIEYEGKKKRLDSVTVDYEGCSSNRQILKNISREKLYETIQLLNKEFDIPIKMFEINPKVAVKVR